MRSKTSKLPAYAGKRWERVIGSLDSPNFWKFGVADLVFLKYLREKKTVLDLGCGTGGATLHLANESQAELIVGVDIMKDMIREAQERASEKRATDKVSFIVCDGRNLPIKKFCFDGLLSRGDAFCFLVPLKSTVKELKRIMKPGGVIVLEMDNRVDWKPGTNISTGFVKTNDDKIAYLITRFTMKRDYVSISYILDPKGELAKLIVKDTELQQKGYKSAEVPLHKVRKETVETRRDTPTHWPTSKALKALIEKGGFKKVEILGDGLLMKLFLDGDPLTVQAMKERPDLFFEIERRLVYYTDPNKTPTMILRATA